MKWLLLPVAFLFLFGGGLLAVNKPFSLRVTVFVLLTGLSLTAIALGTGWIRVVAVGTILVMLVAFPFLRRDWGRLKP